MKAEDFCILVVDDESEILASFTDLFELEGFTVLTASNVEEALSAYKDKKDQIDLVLSDMRMPGDTGIVLLKKIREFDPDVPVFCLFSGQIDSTNELSEDRIIDLGAKKFYHKPINFDELNEDIYKWFDIEG